ncbi:MAG: DNA repair protein RecN [Burkholderiales bacterium]|nr:DNA repair protein RecN [Burkholderiales bacterium]
MLINLTIKDFVIVSSLSLDCTGGLTVLSGETGAGKSILIDALSLCMGERADAAMVRETADSAQITAVFEPNATTRALLAQHDLSCEELVIRRVVYRNGKSKALVNETPVTATLLKTLGETLIDIHGQHAFQSLVKADEQRRLLDSHAGLEANAQAVSQLYKNWRAKQQALEHMISQQDLLTAERERLAWQLDEIDKVGPETGQWELLCAQQERLSHAAELLEGTQAAAQAIVEDENSIFSQLSSISHKIEQLSRKDSHLNGISEILKNAEIQLHEAGRELSAYLRHLDLDPESLAETEERMGRWHSTARKLRIPPEELAERAQQIRQQLKNLDEAADLDAARLQVQALESEFTQAAEDLMKKRIVAAAALSREVTVHGCDVVEFKVAGHAGVTPRALAKVASGGELARISLAIAVITSQSSTIPTLIFDEVDSGIGGAVAETVGKYLRQLAGDRQVLCVTHLAQVASQGQHHWQVSKSFDGQTTRSQIKTLCGEERVGEIARMLGGQTITATTTAAAREMLDAA